MDQQCMRPTVGGRNGAVASAHPLASQVGLDLLRDGGNAVDAVVGMAAALNVVEPYMSGVGGVGLLLLHGRHGASTLNFTSYPPAKATPDQFTPQQQASGPRACLIPGNLAGWCEALSQHGTLSLPTVFAGAVRLARDGFPLHPANARLVAEARPRLNQAGREIFSVDPRIGETLQQSELAKTLTELADAGPDLFYRGALAVHMANHIQSQGGLLTAQDLADFTPQWEDPISITYRGCTIKTCAPNCEGIQILQTLKLLEAFDLASLKHNSTAYIHLLSEAMKLATADRIAYCGDPLVCDVPVHQLLSEEYVTHRRTLMNSRNASRSEGERWRGSQSKEAIRSGMPDGLTTHLAAVDSSGMVASVTQSLGAAFGSGEFVPGTGIALNNFAFWTEIDPDCPTPNLIEPGKRWSCPMAPVHVFRGDQFWFSVGTPGSYGILQTTVQMLLNVVEFGADPQTAIEAPRFRLYEDTRMQIEDRVGDSVRRELRERGHHLESVGDYSLLLGGGQIVMIEPRSGNRLAGADPRRDGYALAY